MRLNNKVALITGGTSGIGEATALLFAKEGAEVAITGRNRERGAAVLERIKEVGSDGIFLHADVSVAGDCRRAVEETVQAFGRLDILFNNAGVFYPHTALECSEKEWDEQIDINLKGTFLMSKFVLPVMIAQRRGVIINNASGWGIVGGDHAVAYCASKGGVVLMTKAMAIDHDRADGRRRRAGKVAPRRIRHLQPGGDRRRHSHDRLCRVRRNAGDDMGADREGCAADGGNNPAQHSGHGAFPLQLWTVLRRHRSGHVSRRQGRRSCEGLPATRSSI